MGKNSETESANHDQGNGMKSIDPAMEARPNGHTQKIHKSVYAKLLKRKLKERGWREIDVSGEADLANTFAETLR